MQQPRIGLFIDTKDLGGAERVVADLAAHLPAHGYAPLVLHFGNDWLVKQCEATATAHCELPGEADYHHKKRFLHFVQRFGKFLRAQKVALLHSHLYGPVTSGAVAARLARRPHVGTFHDTYTIGEKPSRYYFVEVADLLGTQLVAVADSMARYLTSYGHLRRHPFVTVYNGVNANRYLTQSDRLEVRSQLGLKPEQFVIAHVGRLVALKAQEVLIEAVGRMEYDGPVQLLIVGEGPMAATLEERIETTGVHAKVRLLGQRADVDRILAAADCFALTSRTEGLSCSLIEAMGAGLPCVATDVGGNRELVVEQVNGFLMPTDQPWALAARLDQLARDPALRSRMGQAARHRMESLFTVDAMVRGYTSLYQSLLPSLR